MMTKRKEKQIYSSTEVHLSALRLCFVDITVMGDEKSNVIECLWDSVNIVFVCFI